MRKHLFEFAVGDIVTDASGSFIIEIFKQDQVVLRKLDTGDFYYAHPMTIVEEVK